MLRIGDIELCATPRLAGLGLRAIYGLLFFAVGFLADSTAFPSPPSGLSIGTPEGGNIPSAS